MSETRNDPTSSLKELVSVRFKEFLREPEALFWSFGFPILLAIGLGIAFRSKPPEIVHVAVVASSPNAQMLAASLRKDSLIVVESVSADSADVALRTGRVVIVVSSDSA